MGVFMMAVLILLSGIQLSAQEFKASAPASVQAGVPFNYSINGDRQGRVELPVMKNIHVMGGPGQSVSSQTSNVNGRLQTITQVSYTYVLVAEGEGDYEIPPAKITSGNNSYSSNALRISVTKAAVKTQSNTETIQLDEDVILKQIPSRRDIYLGEQIVLETKVYVMENLQITRLDEPKYDGFWREEIAADNVGGNEVLNGRSYRTQVIKRDLLTAQKSGEIRMEPVRMDVTIRKRVKSTRGGGFDDFFNDPFFRDPFDRYENVPASYASNALKINVKPLPAGAPGSFAGSVGQFSFAASLSRDSVQANESLSLKITIKGNGNLALTDAPKIDFPPEIEVFEPKKNSSLSNSINGTTGTLSFEYLLIPRNLGEFRISPIEFSWYDPAVASYKTAKSKEFIFTVKGQSTSGNEGLNGQTPQGFFRDEVKDLNNDIRYLKTDPRTLQKKGLIILRSAWMLVYPLGIIIFIILLILRRKSLERRSNVSYLRNRKANKIAVRRLKNAKRLMNAEDDNFYDEVLKAFWGYFSDKLGINTSDLSRETIEERLILHDVPDDLIKKLWALLDECEYSRYAPGARSDKKEIYLNAEKYLSEIEQNL